MSGKKKWSDTRDARFRSSPDARARYEANGQRFRERLQSQLKTLAELRRARDYTQKQLASALQVSQAQVSRVENQTDLYLSTLRGYIEALGGQMQIRVTFPGSEWTEVSIGDVTAAPIHASSTTDFSPIADSVRGGLGSVVAKFYSAGRVSTPVSTGSVGQGWLAVYSRLGSTTCVVMDVSHSVKVHGLGSHKLGSALTVQYTSEEVGKTGELQSSIDWISSNGLQAPEDPAQFIAWANSKKGEVAR